ncbi:vitamin B12 import system permease protein BtuC [Streptomyces griseus]
MDLRLPRALAGLIVGIALGVSGTITQSVARNPLASPDILGITSGAGAVAVPEMRSTDYVNTIATKDEPFFGAVPARNGPPLMRVERSAPGQEPAGTDAAAKPFCQSWFTRARSLASGWALVQEGPGPPPDISWLHGPE